MGLIRTMQMPEPKIKPSMDGDWKSDRLGMALASIIGGPILAALVSTSSGKGGQALILVILGIFAPMFWGSLVIYWATGWNVSRWWDGGKLTGWILGVAGFWISAMIIQRFGLISSHWFADYVWNVEGHSWDMAFMVYLPSLLFLELLMVAGTVAIAAPVVIIRKIFKNGKTPPP